MAAPARNGARLRASPRASQRGGAPTGTTTTPYFDPGRSHRVRWVEYRLLTARQGDGYKMPAPAGNGAPRDALFQGGRPCHIDQPVRAHGSREGVPHAAGGADMDKERAEVLADLRRELSSADALDRTEPRMTTEQLRSLLEGVREQHAFYRACGFEDMAAAEHPEAT